jgi:hypothetical protein
LEAVLPRRNILIGKETVITGETETEMIAIAETIDTMTGMGITAPTRTHDSKATAMAYRLARLMPNVVKVTIRSDHISGKTVRTATTHVTETRVSTNRSFVTHLSKATVKVTPGTVGTTTAATMDDGEMAGFGRGK